MPSLRWGMFGTGVDAQAYADSRINSIADAGIDFGSFLCILPPEIYAATPDHNALLESYSIPFQKYHSSPFKSRLKFLLILQAISLRYPYPGFPALPANTTDGGAYLAQWGAFVAAQIADPDYLRLQAPGVNGGLPTPVVGLYQSSAMPLAMWSTFLAAVGTPIMLVDWNRNNIDGATLGATVMNEYPPNPGRPSTLGQHPYSDQAAIDVGYANPIGFNTTGLVTQGTDSRPTNPLGPDANVPWVDRPTQPDWLAHVGQMGKIISSGVRPLWVNLHAYNEHFEDGPGLEPTDEEGTRFLDGVKWAKFPGTRPSTMTYSLSTEHSACVKTGAWAMQRMFASACFANAEEVTSGVGDTLVLSHIFCTVAAIYGSTLPGGGSFTVQVDGVTVATVNTAAGTTTRHVLLWTGSLGTEGTHTVGVTVTAGPVRLDAIGITCNPSRFPL